MPTILPERRSVRPEIGDAETDGVSRVPAVDDGEVRAHRSVLLESRDDDLPRRLDGVRVEEPEGPSLARRRRPAALPDDR